MPDDVRDALAARALRASYDARPWYQRNDYLIWIAGAKREETRQKRLNQMLEELRAAGIEVNEADRARFRDASDAIYEEFAEDVDGGGELVRRVGELAG